MISSVDKFKWSIVEIILLYIITDIKFYSLMIRKKILSDKKIFSTLKCLVRMTIQTRDNNYVYNIVYIIRGLLRIVHNSQALRCIII